ncbi:FecR family protein, partial [Oxalicibacterium faecigallinarum]|uniref:FecR family protein n=1 Tax=Oxalicibacterium faecigallinarum TaxID=573741 RepID=UPI00280BC859
MEWSVVFSSNEVTAEERANFENWLSADSRHAAAWANVSRIFSNVQSLNATAADKALRSKPVSSSRRKVLFGIGLVAGTGILSYTASKSSQWQVISADYRTATGERQAMSLPDGTQIVINTASAVNVEFSPLERRIVVLRGEILVTTASDNASTSRPFIVETDAGDIRAIGTRFSVRKFEDVIEDDVSVHVFEGAVEVGPRNSGSKALVHAGQQIKFSRDGTNQLQSTDDIAAAWSDGKLIAERMRLADFLSELSRYRPGIVRCNHEVADILVSGV